MESAVELNCIGYHCAAEPRGYIEFSDTNLLILVLLEGGLGLFLAITSIQSVCTSKAEGRHFR